MTSLPRTYSETSPSWPHMGLAKMVNLQNLGLDWVVKLDHLLLILTKYLTILKLNVVQLTSLNIHNYFYMVAQHCKKIIYCILFGSSLRNVMSVCNYYNMKRAKFSVQKMQNGQFRRSKRHLGPWKLTLEGGQLREMVNFFLIMNF